MKKMTRQGLLCKKMTENGKKNFLTSKKNFFENSSSDDVIKIFGPLTDIFDTLTAPPTKLKKFFQKPRDTTWPKIKRRSKEISSKMKDKKVCEQLVEIFLNQVMDLKHFVHSLVSMNSKNSSLLEFDLGIINDLF